MDTLRNAINVLKRHNLCSKEALEKILTAHDSRSLTKLQEIARWSDVKHFTAYMRDSLSAHISKNLKTVLNLKTDTAVKLILDELRVLVIVDSATGERIGDVVKDLSWKGVVDTCRVVDEAGFCAVLFDEVVAHFVKTKCALTDGKKTARIHSPSDMKTSYSMTLASAKESSAASRVAKKTLAKKTLAKKTLAAKSTWQEVPAKRSVAQKLQARPVLPFVSIVKILGIEKELKQVGYHDNGMHPPAQVKCEEILKGMIDLGGGYQKPRLKKRNAALFYPFSFRINEKGTYSFYEENEKGWDYISFDEAKRRHVSYWKKSQQIMRSSY